jgi:UDP-glucose 4-epimerase
LTEADDAEPSDLYGRSKLAAENAITEAGVAFTILRPVLVYGPGAKGNLASLQRLSASPWPLPLGAFENRRSLLGIDNLIAAILLAIENPVCANQIYIAADPKPLTLAEIVAALRDAAGRSPRLVAVPPMLFKAALTAAGKSEAWQRLGGELVADPTKLIAAGWHPPVETRAGLAAMVRAARG